MLVVQTFQGQARMNAGRSPPRVPVFAFASETKDRIPPILRNAFAGAANSEQVPRRLAKSRVAEFPRPELLRDTPMAGSVKLHRGTGSQLQRPLGADRNVQVERAANSHSLRKPLTSAMRRSRTVRSCQQKRRIRFCSRLRDQALSSPSADFVSGLAAVGRVGGRRYPKPFRDCFFAGWLRNSFRSSGFF